MTTTNPLDRIRTLAPADMTDDDLGVAVLLAAGCKSSVNSSFADIEVPPNFPFAVSVRTDGTVTGFNDRQPHPSKSLAALLPIVREWVGRSPDRMIALTLGLDRGVMESLAESVQDMRRDCADWRFDETLATSWCLLQLTPRQLAEAFVTAAREVGNDG